MFSGVSVGEVCDDCGRHIKAGAYVCRDVAAAAGATHRRCKSCQWQANYNPLNKSASLNPNNYR